MSFIRTIHGSYVNADRIDYIYIGEADFNGETGYTVDAVSGDKTDTLYFSADKAEAELYLGWAVCELCDNVLIQSNFERECLRDRFFVERIEQHGV